MLESMPQAEMAAKSALAMDHLTGTSEYARAQIIMVYLSLPTEIDTTGIVLRAWQDHKRVLAPRISWEQRRMMPTEIRSLTSDLVETSMGLREPVSGPPAGEVWVWVQSAGSFSPKGQNFMEWRTDPLGRVSTRTRIM